MHKMIDTTSSGAGDSQPQISPRESFQQERDEELGRWRWPEKPDYVVYPRPDGQRVMRESDGDSAFIGTYGAPTNNYFSMAAFAYRSEFKPWFNAKPGEAWELTANGDTGPFLVVTQHSRGGGTVFVATNGTQFEITDAEQITAGHRIWPEATS